ncbi:MAG TPA: DUF1015 domain-containing protein [Pelolinea sp.]|nr:DUF1015 domain-containing protein [Pelolinea sp.]
MRIYPSIGIQAPDLFIPNNEINMSKWAVVACDQFTSEPEYWEEVKKQTENYPSTYHLILPEAYLGKEIGQTHLARIRPLMAEYVKSSVFRSVEGFIYVERETVSGIRKGLVAALDLEKYDYNPQSTSMIRATEGTIVDRLPPRIKIRENALLEIPHILVLIDDPELSVIKPVSRETENLDKLYDFDLIQNGGHIRGYLVNDQQVEDRMISALENLANQETQKNKYGIDRSPLLYAVGDGNHSLATAKSIWNKLKGSVNQNHPARFAMVELVNIHDPSIVFEPIHRLLKNIHFDFFSEMDSFFQRQIKITPINDYKKLVNEIQAHNGNTQKFGLISNKSLIIVELRSPIHTLAVGNVQKFLDDLLDKNDGLEIDYIHGDEAILQLGSQPEASGIVLPSMDKFKLFESVIKDGPLPRKTFSMGEANEKRYYLECRKIKEI